MTEPDISLNDSKNQVYKQAGLFAEDGDVVLLTKAEKEAIYSKAYRELNYGKVNIQRKSYRFANSDKLKERSKAWCAANPEKKKAQDKAYRATNLEKAKASAKKTNYTNVKYNTYKDRLQKYENISQNSDGTLLVGCVYCGKLYAPIRTQVYNRIQAINERLSSENRFYCSQFCKIACPTYNQRTCYKFQRIGHTREVPAEFRQIALLDRNYTCENCGSDENGLHVHHINGYTESPMEMADLNNVKVLCSKCHKAVHSIPGCSFVDYSCRNQKQ